ncbi:MAG TPA: PP2C family protein-serine/threonine phosphatase, partial [Turneriella sp.]|nr:PP2C family protein-serine/threonine phosphatase [Turneriella sp.]
ELKTQQDGDYFLTSLLIEPLSANRVESNYTKVQFFVKEKKEFSFRRWSRDIGGDMCIAHTVELRGRKFTIALNADAMGKSMQGAGGALVLGSVFASIIERTRSASIVRDSAPETWLRAAFMELNRVFESFDGSMLVSVVLAAIDDEAGVMYYINAEHPWSVIYRNGKAAFTDEDFMLRKLGTLVGNENIQVHVFYLEDNDVVIMGSDGRDDLILGIDHEGHRIINEDETLFLKHVEDAKADLPKLVETLKETGDLSDDLSFIRIEYHAPEHRRAPIRLGDSQAVENFKTNLKTNAKPLTIHDIDIILTRHQHNATEMHYAIRWLIQLKQYEKAGEWAEKFATEFPMETEFLYLAALGYKLAGRYGEALDFSERLFVRIASHEKNLINLVDLQILLKRKGDAENALSFLNKYFPHNEKIVKLKQALEQI